MGGCVEVRGGREGRILCGACGCADARRERGETEVRRRVRWNTDCMFVDFGGWLGGGLVVVRGRGTR